MSLVLLAVVVLVVFAVCAWSGNLLAHHYQDRWEVAAVVAIGGCVLGALALTSEARADGAVAPMIALGIGAGAGLFAGFWRDPRLR
jgi:uncharacterized membrane protein